MPKNRRILIVAPYGFNDRMMNFIEFVSARLLAKNGWRVDVVVKSDTNRMLQEDVYGMTVHRYTTVLQGLKTLFSLILSRPHIVHVHNLRNNRVGIATAFLAKLFRARLLCTEYGLLHDHYLTDFRDDPLNHSTHPERVIISLRQLISSTLRNSSKAKYFFYSYVFHWPLSHADHLVFVSKHNIPIAKSLGLPAATYLPQLSDDIRWKKTDAHEETAHEREIRSKLATLSGPSALFIGQMKLRKGWDVLLRAIPFVKESDIGTFVIVSASSVSERKEFSELVDSLGIRARVLYLGAISNNELLRSVYNAASVVAVPSRYEGFGLVPLEAFEMKKPVVASRVEALTEYLTDENSVLVPPEDPKALGEALTRVAGDREMREKLVRGGEATLTRLKSEEYRKQWLSFYEGQLV